MGLLGWMFVDGGVASVGIVSMAASPCGGLASRLEKITLDHRLAKLSTIPIYDCYNSAARIWVKLLGNYRFLYNRLEQ